MSDISRTQFVSLSVAVFFLAMSESQGCYDDELVWCANIVTDDEEYCNDTACVYLEVSEEWWCFDGSDNRILPNKVSILLDDEYGLDGYTNGTQDIPCMGFRFCLDTCVAPEANGPDPHCRSDHAYHLSPWHNYRHSYATGAQCDPEAE